MINNIGEILKQNSPFFILLILAFLTRFLFLSYPAEVVFDEVHFGKYVSAYFTNRFYFDIHPPFGKLMIAGFAGIFGFGGNFDFAEIGKVYDAENLFILRFLPALFGVLFVLLIYQFVLTIGLSKKSAFLAGFLILFDNAFLVQSKFILVDMFLLFFGFLALYFFILARTKTKNVYYALAAISAGLAFSVKWTGFSFLGLILLFLFFDFLKNFRFREFLIKLAVFVFVPFVIYLSFFVIHFNLLSKSGPDDAYMSPGFQKSLSGNNIADSAARSLSFWQKFTELNQKMYFYSSTLKEGHPDGSKWYQWPIMEKPVWYWTGPGRTVEKTANIYLLGNLLTWWSAVIAVPIAFFILLIKKFRRRLPPITYLFLAGYFANLLPFIFISRVTFLYHYFASLIFGVLIFVLLTEKFLRNNLFYFSFLSLILLVFLIFLPLTYGLPLAPETNQFYGNLIKLIH